MELQLNHNAPNFAQNDIFGRHINLEDYQGKKVLLGFFRHAGCPFCNIRVHELMKKQELFKEKGLEMIFFFESPERILLRSSFHEEISPIPLLSDPEKKIYTQYGIEESAAGSAKGHLLGFVSSAIKAKQLKVPMHTMAAGESIKTMPAEFLIDEKGIIRFSYHSKKLTDRMPMEEILDFIDDKKAYRETA